MVKFTKKRKQKHSLTKRKNKKYIKKLKQKGGGDPILPEDIMYEDFDVCILKPGVKKGVLVFTHYTQPPDMDTLCKLGLKTGLQLSLEGVNFGRSIQHPYIFFRAPYRSTEIDYSSVEKEIESSFDKYALNDKNLVFIRVDPDKTFVYPSEIRVKFRGKNIDKHLKESRKTMTEYFKILKENEEEIKTIPSGYGPIYDLISSKIINSYKYASNNNGTNVYVSNNNVTKDYGSKLTNTIPIERNSEVLVRIPHLTPDYFVRCT
jgi:hypothetical protein